MTAPTPAGLRALHDDLIDTYGPQHWWPVQDVDNPRFEILVGAILTQHTAWTQVEQAIASLLEAGPLTPETLLTHADLAGLIRSAGPHNVKAARLRALCEWFVQAGGFDTLDTLDSTTLRWNLLARRGIGFETADVIGLYAFNRPCFVADAYAFRIFERYGWWQGARRYEALRRVIEAVDPDDDAPFYAELHALIVAHAKARCHKRAPDCGHCVLAHRCAWPAARLSAQSSRSDVD